MKKGVRIIAIHYIKLILRLIAFILLLVLYINKGDSYIMNIFSSNSWILIIVWLLIVIEIGIRALNIGIESMGCQKIFKKNYIKEDLEIDDSTIIKPRKYTPLIVAGICIALLIVYSPLYFNGIINNSILILICLFYGICDTICVLFYCPFQHWFMKNKCCVSCRIYNWDYALILSPLIFIFNIYTISLIIISLLIIIQWEIIYMLHPERFSEKTNRSLQCRYCEERLCQYKKLLQKFVVKQKKKLRSK